MQVSRRAFLAGCSLAALGSPANAWRFGSPELLFILYGQSNMGQFISAADSPPAALSGTRFYDPVNGWGTPPAANGIREFLNAMRTATGRPVAAINGSVTGSTIAFLSDETPSGGLGLFYTQMTAAGVTSADMILFMQGEGNANTTPPTSEASYKTSISDLHTKMVAHFSRTKAQCPFVHAGLTTYGTTGGGNTDETWFTIRAAQFHAAQEQANVYFSHSNMDGVRTDNYHLDGASQGRAGKRYAQTVKFLMGLGGGQAHFEITGSATVDATHTDVTVAHSSGATDFTPTSGITGFDVSGDNGAVWASVTGARQDASTIRLTHSSLTTDNRRVLRYQYGMLPDVSSPVLDNSTLALPLTFTPDILTPTPLSTIPLATYRSGTTLTGSGQVQTATAVSIGSAGAQKMLIVALIGTSKNGTLTLTPNVGTAVVATLVNRTGSIGIYRATLLSDADTATQVDISVDYGVANFTGTICDIWSAPSLSLNSTTPTGSNGTTSAAGQTTTSTTLATTTPGFVIAASRSSNATSNSGTISGTETYVQRMNTSSGIQRTVGDASGAATNVSSSVTTTYTQTGTIDLVAVAWR